MKPDQTTILVVDDSLIIRNMMVKHLQAAGFTQILTAPSGLEALELLRRKVAHLVLSGWLGHAKSGLDLLLDMRGDEDLSGIPFILITGELQREHAIEAVQAGVDDLLLKPFKPNELLKKVHKALLISQTPDLTLPSAFGKPVQAPRPQPTLLVVDDMPANLTLISDLLRERYIVKLATRGAKALELCRLNPPDLILLDIMMPEMDGFEVCRLLKEDAQTAFIPVIFLTALDDLAKTVAGFELGAVDYITKPIEPELLKARITSALRISQAHEDLREQYDLALENARLREAIGRIKPPDLKDAVSSIIDLSSALLGNGVLDDAQRQQVKGILQATCDML